MVLYFVFLLITYQKRTLKSEASYGNSKSLKNDEKCFFLTLKTLFLLKTLKVLSLRFAHIEKQLDYKDVGIFKIYYVTT